MLKSKHMLKSLKDRSTKLKGTLKKVSHKKVKSDQYLVGLDIGTEYVKALIGKVSKTNPGNIDIVGVGRAHQGLKDMQAGAIADIAAVVANCDKALAEAEDMAGVSARTAVLGIAGELVKGTTKTIKVTRSNPKEAIDVPEMEKIINLVQQRTETKAKQELAYELGGKNVDVRLVNSALVSIEIDGYPVSNPIGFQGRDVVVSIYTAFAPLIHIGALEKTALELDLDLLAVAAEPFAVARAVIGNNANNNLSAVLMDIGGGTTDIAVVNEGGVQGTKMFGIGGRAFTRSIEKELGVDFEEAEELKVSLTGNEIDPKKRPSIEKPLEKTADIWVSGIELALDEFDQLDHLPNRLYLCGGGSSLEMLIDKLEQTNWYKALPFTKKPIVKHIRPDQVVGVEDHTNKVNDHTFITAMGLLRVGLDTTQSNAVNSSFRDKIDRMLSI